MDVEVAVAWNFVISHLYNKLPRRRVLCFGEALDRGLKRKFQGHWYPDMPFKGSAFRSVKVTGVAADPVIELAARECGVAIEEVREFLPDELTVWIDPKEVSYRIGEKGLVKILYSARKEEFSCEVIDTEMQSILSDSVSTSLSSLPLTPDEHPPTCPPWAPVSPTHLPAHLHQPLVIRNQQEQKFTAAMFAQTKFGSTKLKSNAKRPNRLSPVELGGYLPPQHRSMMPANWMSGVGAVSPAGMASYNAVNGFPGPAVYPGAALQQPCLQQQRRDVIAQQQQQQQHQHHGTAGSAADMRHDVTQQQRLLFYEQQQQQQQQQQHMLQHSMLAHANNSSPLGDANLNIPIVQAPPLLPPVLPANINHDVTTEPIDDTSSGGGGDDATSDLGLAGIMSRLNELEAATTNDPVWSSTGTGTSSPYANLQHLLVAN